MRNNESAARWEAGRQGEQTAWENCHGHYTIDLRGTQVQKPYQTKKPISADNDALYEVSEEALDSIAAAMEALRGYWELDHIFDALGGVYDDLKDMFDEYDAIASEEQRKEIEGLTRQYWRDAI